MTDHDGPREGEVRFSRGRYERWHRGEWVPIVKGASSNTDPVTTRAAITRVAKRPTKKAP